MAISKVLYFNGTVQVTTPHAIGNARFAAIGGIRNKHNYADSFTRLVCRPIEGPDAILPITRVIFRKANPSNHKCDARCLHATGQHCECSCGGKFHGAGAFD